MPYETGERSDMDAGLIYMQLLSLGYLIGATGEKREDIKDYQEWVAFHFGK